MLSGKDVVAALARLDGAKEKSSKIGECRAKQLTEKTGCEISADVTV